MKKINLLIIFVLAGTIGFITSCKKDPVDYASPTITFTHGDQEVDSNTAVTITGSVLAPGKLEKIQFFKDDTGYGDAVTKDFNTDTTHSFTVVITAAEVKETFTFEVQVTDKEGNLSKKVATITVIPPEHAGPVDKTTVAIRLYAAPGDQSNIHPRFASLTPDFDTYTWGGAVTGGATVIATIDVLYYNSDWTKGESNPHFLSPDTKTTAYDIHNDETLLDANTTYFKVLDDGSAFSDWDNIDDDTEINAITGITEVNVTWDDGGAAGTIIAFELANGKKGVIRAGNAVDGNGNTEYWDAAHDYIEFDVIVQQNAPAK